MKLGRWDYGSPKAYGTYFLFDKSWTCGFQSGQRPRDNPWSPKERSRSSSHHSLCTLHPVSAVGKLGAHLKIQLEKPTRHSPSSSSTALSFHSSYGLSSQCYCNLPTHCTLFLNLSLTASYFFFWVTLIYTCQIMTFSMITVKKKKNLKLGSFPWRWEQCRLCIFSPIFSSILWSGLTLGSPFWPPVGRFTFSSGSAASTCCQ